MSPIRRSALMASAFCALCAVATAQSDAGFQPLVSWSALGNVRTSNRADTVLVRNGTIRTDTIYSDFVLQFEFRLLNSSSQGRLFVRSRFGYDNDPNDERGYLVALTNQRDGKNALGRMTAAEVKLREVSFEPVGALRQVGEWQECELRAERDAATVKINGMVVSTLQGLDEFAGYIALQSKGDGGVEFRNVRAMPLPRAHEPFGQGAHPAREAGVELPRPIQQQKPFYPVEPYAAGIQGSVLLEVVVESTGSIGDVRVTRSVHPDLDEAAIASVRKWQFKPGTKSGQPIAVIVTIEVTFRNEAQPANATIPPVHQRR